MCVCVCVVWGGGLRWVAHRGSLSILFSRRTISHQRQTSPTPLGVALSVSIIKEALLDVTGDGEGRSIWALVQLSNYPCYPYCFN